MIAACPALLGNDLDDGYLHILYSKIVIKPLNITFCCHSPHSLSKYILK